MDNLIIRKATEDDAEGIIEYLNIIGGESDNLTFGENEIKITVEEEQKFIKSMNESDKNRMFIGVIGEKIVSTLSVRGNERKRLSHIVEIGISVKKKYWHGGIGTKMIEEAIEFAKSINIRVIQLEVRADNINAINLYEKMGFEKIGFYKDFLMIDDKYYDFVLMNLYLN